MLITTPLKYAAWYYLPGYATRQLLAFVHQGYTRATGRPPPPPGTPAYAFHYRMTYLFCAVVYLLYNLYDAATTLDPNYYELLGLAPSADEGMLKAAFRQFARKHHPDRAGAKSEEMFIEVRDAYDALKSPVKRFAYERFGPEALKWSQCTTLREYVRHGLLQASGFYIVSLCSLIFFSFVSPSSPVSYWRYLMLAFTAVYELLFLLGPSVSPASASTTFSSVIFADPAATTHTSLFAFLWPRRVPYQHVRFLHNLWVLGCFALSNVVPVVFPAPSAAFEEQWVFNEAKQIASLSSSILRETNAHIATLFHSAHGPRTGTPASEGTFPYVTDLPLPNRGKPADQVVALLATEMEHLILETQLRADGGPLRSAVDNAVERGRRRMREGGGGGTGRPVRGGQISGVWGSQLNGSVVGIANGVGAGSPGRKLGYVRGRSRSLG
ncbi:DnaJ-domain-containing protein [Pilatotrama ljubarskyi]|nr:DnaJ-domain-containing protein [Pilatotrama ljubarskyi]